MKRALKKPVRARRKVAQEIEVDEPEIVIAETAGRTARPEIVGPRERRRKRGSNVGGAKLRLVGKAKEDPLYFYFWANDVKNNLAEMLDNDYDFVNEDGDHVEPRSSSRYSVHVGTRDDHSPMLAYRMRKFKEWYDADKKDEQDLIDERMKEMQQVASDARSKPTGLNIRVHE